MKIPIHIRPISNILGALLLLISGMMLLCLPFSLYYQDGDTIAIILSAVLTASIGLFLRFLRRKESTWMTKREVYLIVTVGWLAMVGVSMLPYLFSGTIPNVVEAFFETMSGMTTTGASILNDIEAMPKGILFWRSMTQWIGGMGIIVLTVAIFPFLGIAGIELFVAEMPGPTSDKIHPRIKETARRLWLIYVALTCILFLLLWAEGMTFYDAANHALTTMATGGFSTKNASIAYFTSPWIQYTIALFMFIAGTNYTLIYFGLLGRFKRILKSEEYLVYLSLLSLSVVIASGVIYFHTDTGLETAFRSALFMVISIVTTTGFVTADYTVWGTGLMTYFFMLLFVGACAGSTSGGIKLVRHLVFLKNSVLEFKRILHPKAMIRIKINQEVVAPRILTHILVFLLIYLATFVGGTILLSSMGLDIVSSAGAVATSLGNVGPGIGSVGPLDNFAHLSLPIKGSLSFIMLLGRLELFTVLILFSPYFWRSN